MPLSFNGRLTRVEQRVQSLVYGEDLTPTAQELAEEDGFRQRLAAWHQQWDYVGARHSRSDFIKTIGAIPDDWPCHAIHPDCIQDWESIQPGDTHAVRFWIDVGHRLRDHKATAEALGVSPAELPLWTDEAYWDAYHEDLVAELEDAIAAGDTSAVEWLAVAKGERLPPSMVEERERYRKELCARFDVPLEQVPAEAVDTLWRYPWTRKELLRGVRDWRRRQSSGLS